MTTRKTTKKTTTKKAADSSTPAVEPDREVAPEELDSSPGGLADMDGVVRHRIEYSHCTRNGEPQNPGPHLARAIASVMAAVKSVEKDSRNSHQGYEYASEAAISNALRPLMGKHGLALLPVRIDVLEYQQGFSERFEYPEGGGNKYKIPGQNCEILTRSTFMLLHDSGEWMHCEVISLGRDTADKATGKAATYARKTLMLDLFVVGRGHDPDATSPAADETPPQAPPKRQEPKQPPKGDSKKAEAPAGRPEVKITRTKGSDGKVRHSVNNWKDFLYATGDGVEAISILPMSSAKQECGATLAELPVERLRQLYTLTKAKVDANHANPRFGPLLEGLIDALAKQGVEVERTPAEGDDEIPF